jgi:hypothetical protein
VDWSPFRVTIAGVLTLVHCFSLILAFSRMLFIAFFRNEKLSTLLHAHVEAYQYIGGVCHRQVYDNMATVCLGRSGGKPIWNPSFLEFAKYYCFQPFVCRVRDPNRKGKVESPFKLIFSDFLKGSFFASWDDLNARARTWLDTVANVRVHSTTRRRPVDLFAEEKDLLIALPPAPYPTGRELLRKVQQDGYIPVEGSLYPVPASLPGPEARVWLYPDRVEILDPEGKVVATHKVPDRATRVPADYAPVPSKPEAFSLTALQTRFLASFPAAKAFLEGLEARMKSLSPIHLRQIEKLAEIYGLEAVGLAIERATSYGNFSALALRRILEAAHPNTIPEPPVQPLSIGPAALGALDDVESGSPESYTVDTDEVTNHEE